MSEISVNIEVDFLGAAGSNQRVVWVFLVNGIRLTGSVSAFDRHTILLESANGTLLIYKHAIATVCEPYERLYPAGDGGASVKAGPRVARKGPRG